MAGGRRIVPVGSMGRSMRGHTCLYVLPCANEDHVKLGIAGDPMTRMQAFSSRYFEFFDLDAGWLLEAGSEAEARGWETALKRQLRAHAAPPPLLVPARAGGHTEWLRGAGALLAAWRDGQVARGFVAHAPLRGWVRQRLIQAHERWHHDVQALLDRFGPAGDWPAADGSMPLRQLRDAMDAQVLLDARPPDDDVPGLRAWHARNRLVAAPACPVQEHA